MSNKNIAIFTNFFGYDESYSLIRVAEDQIKMLVRHGYKPMYPVIIKLKTMKLLTKMLMI